MSVSEKAIMAAMMGDLTTEEAGDLAMIDMLVQRDIFCPGSGKLLDSRKAILVEATRVDGEQQFAVIHPDEQESAKNKADQVHTQHPEISFRFVNAADLLGKI